MIRTFKIKNKTSKFQTRLQIRKKIGIKTEKLEKMGVFKFFWLWILPTYLPTYLPTKTSWTLSILMIPNNISVVGGRGFGFTIIIFGDSKLLAYFLTDSVQNSVSPRSLNSFYIVNYYRKHETSWTGSIWYIVCPIVYLCSI